MSTPTKSTEPTTKPAPQPERGVTMSGAEILVECLIREGVDVIFAYPGGASMHMHQALTKREDVLRTYLPRHEQGGVFAAEGYARATGKAGVVMATSGPGATNLVTGIADAYLDSTPLVAITGQVPRHMIGKGAFQETDVFSVTAQIVKHNFLVMDVNDIARIVKEAFYIATTGRPGPVLIDIPKDVQIATTQPIFPTEVKLRGYDPVKHADDAALNEVIGHIKNAKCPMIYCGGGIISGEASAELLEFVERTGIPVATTLMGIGCFPETHELSLKWLGMHGTVYANNAVNEADLLLAIGVRFDDRVTGKISEFAKHGTIVHIDIDNSEINKNKVVKLPILSDVKYALAKLNGLLEKAGKARVKKGFTAFPDWYVKIAAWREEFPFTFNDTEDVIQPPCPPRRTPSRRACAARAGSAGRAPRAIPSRPSRQTPPTAPNMQFQKAGRPPRGCGRCGTPQDRTRRSWHRPARGRRWRKQSAPWVCGDAQVYGSLTAWQAPRLHSSSWTSAFTSTPSPITTKCTRTARTSSSPAAASSCRMRRVASSSTASPACGV